VQHCLQADDVIAAALSAHGRVDGVANCIGSIVLKSAHTTSDKEWADVMTTNLTSCFNVLRPAVKAMMRSGGGSVAFCSSAVAQQGIPNHEAIAAAKAGVVGAQKQATTAAAAVEVHVCQCQQL
jgi:3-oxoacyl-[acyl-carrier protein] reductase